MKIVDNTRHIVCNVKPHAIPIGIVFVGRIGSHRGTFLRHYDGFVDLEDCSNTWDNGLPDVDEYCPVVATLKLSLRE